MSTFLVQFNTDNDAFDDPGSEIARVLTKVAEAADYGSLDYDEPHTLLDSNGNRVGHYIWAKEG